MPDSNICMGQKKGIKATLQEIQYHFHKGNNYSLLLGCLLCYLLIPSHLKAAQLQRVWEGVRGKKEKEKKPTQLSVLLCRDVILPFPNLRLLKDSS